MVKKAFFLTAFLGFSVMYLMGEGAAERFRPSNATIEEVTGIFDENYQFVVFEKMKNENKDEESMYGKNGIYELYINNDFIFWGKFFLLCGGERIDEFDFRHYNFVINVPQKIFNEFEKGAKMSKETLVELLQLPHRAETLQFNADNFDINLFDKLFNMAEYYEDIDDLDPEEITGGMGERLIHNTSYYQTLKERNSNNFITLFLLMMLMSGEMIQ